MMVSDSPPRNVGFPHQISHNTTRMCNPSTSMQKTKQEIFTSFHLIKDIRRLETYQRDFFLKVRESLSHVQMNLEHQLSGMAWADSLMDCEESLIMASGYLSTSSPEKLDEICKVLVLDREKLSGRFHELSARCSLSEFVVNSRKILDVENVRTAVDAILKNECPQVLETDNSVPIDHSFFLANYCVSNIASGIFSTHNYSSATAIAAAAATTKQLPRCNINTGASYDNFSPPTSSYSGLAQMTNDTNSSLTSELNDSPPSITGSCHKMYRNTNAAAYGSIYGQSNGGTTHNDETVVANVPLNMFGQELVSAISQITRQDETSPIKLGGSAGATGVCRPSPSNDIAVNNNRLVHERAAVKTELWPGESIDNHEGASTTDTTSTTSNGVGNEECAGGAKPISFARVASRNLEKSNATTSSKRWSVSATLPWSRPSRFYLDVAMEGKRLGRVIIDVEPQVAPRMSHNFSMLVTGERGFGYKGCQFFQAWKNESVICGDWEQNSGRGGKAAFEESPLFTPDDTKLPCIRGAVGMRRMSKKHSTLNEVASQFRIILANMNTQFTGIFGHVVSGLEVIDKVANCGLEGGRPDKIAVITDCGPFNSF